MKMFFIIFALLFNVVHANQIHTKNTPYHDATCLWATLNSHCGGANFFMERHCSKCDQVKSLEDFYVRSVGTYGRHTICKKCQSNRTGKNLIPINKIEGEIWKDIIGYEGLYQISNLGRVKSVKKRHNQKEYAISSNIGTTGYYAIGLYKNSKGSNKKIHRLVAQAFIPNPESKPHVNHIDGNKLNNNVFNLEWATVKENVNHAIRIGLNNPKIQSRNKKVSVNIDGMEKIFDSLSHASRELKTSRNTIIRSLNGFDLINGLKYKYI